MFIRLVRSSFYIIEVLSEIITMYSRITNHLEEGSHNSSGEGAPSARYSPYPTKLAIFSEKCARQSKSENQHIPHSPEFKTTQEDYRQFETDVQKKYGVSSEARDSENQLNREKRRLLSAMCLPLNNCGSKYIYIGLDPFNDFAPSVRILKSGVDDGARFTAVTFQDFMDNLAEVITHLKDGTLHNFGLVDYKLETVGNQTFKFVPKKAGGFELYMAISTLLKLQQMGNFIFKKIEFLENCTANYTSNFNQLCEEVVDDAVSRQDLSVDINVVFKIMNVNHKQDVMLWELIYKCPNFILKEVYMLLDLDDRINPYFLKF